MTNNRFCAAFRSFILRENRVTVLRVVTAALLAIIAVPRPGRTPRDA